MLPVPYRPGSRALAAGGGPPVVIEEMACSSALLCLPPRFNRLYRPEQLECKYLCIPNVKAECSGPVATTSPDDYASGFHTNF